MADLDDTVQQLRQRHHELADKLQNYVVKAALQEQTNGAVLSELQRLRETTVSHDELTGALGPIRGDLALHAQAQASFKDALSKTATSEQLASAIALVRSDSLVIAASVSSMQSSMTWVTRALIGGVVSGTLGLIWFLVERGLGR